jgi:gluconate 2-dehydrogenase alpha chain
MGPHSGRGVVNTYLQHWDVPNLWVIGASAFPQNGAGNPTMTALALTYRSADALIGRYLKAPGPLA